MIIWGEVRGRAHTVGEARVGEEDDLDGIFVVGVLGAERDDPLETYKGIHKTRALAYSAHKRLEWRACKGQRTRSMPNTTHNR